MRRRHFIAIFAGAALAAGGGAFAQTAERQRRIAMFMGIANGSDAAARVNAFRQRLEEFGWSERKNVKLEFYWAEGDPERFQNYAATLVGTAPDVVLATSPPALAALRQETKTIPIVFMMVPDPVRSGIVTSLAKPGGNITGIANYEYSIAGKWVEILKQMAPAVSRVLIVCNPKDPTWSAYWQVFAGAANLFNVVLRAADIADLAKAELDIKEFSRTPNGCLVVMPTPLTSVHRKQLVELASRHMLPAIYPYRYFVSDGGLASYGIQGVDLYRRAAEYVARVLGGANPGDLPIIQAAQFELTINLKTAKALGLTVPRALLFSAVEVIE